MPSIIIYYILYFFLLAYTDKPGLSRWPMKPYWTRAIWLWSAILLQSLNFFALLAVILLELFFITIGDRFNTTSCKWMVTVYISVLFCRCLQILSMECAFKNSLIDEEDLECFFLHWPKAYGVSLHPNGGPNLFKGKVMIVSKFCMLSLISYQISLQILH